MRQHLPLAGSVRILLPSPTEDTHRPRRLGITLEYRVGFINHTPTAHLAHVIDMGTVKHLRAYMLKISGHIRVDVHICVPLTLDTMLNLRHSLFSRCAARITTRIFNVVITI